MTVDLSKAVKGSTVHFRCGGSAVVTDNSYWGLTFKEYEGERYGYRENGRNGEGALLDIIRIDPPAFNWDDVRPGMAFKDSKGNVWIYRYTDERWDVFSNPNAHYPHDDGAHIGWNGRCSDLIRAPEHDIEVKG